MKSIFLGLVLGAAALTAGDAVAHALSSQTLSMLSPHSLNRFYRNDYSQCGEDGILEEVFKRLNIKTGYFVECGAADGVRFSNCRKLWEKGWSGLMIEGDPKRFAQLQHNYRGQGRIQLLKALITWDKNDGRRPCFDRIAQAYFPGREIDLVSIDVDGEDLQIFESMVCRPKVMLIETQLHWHPLMTKRIPEAYAAQNLGQPLAVAIESAKKRGYVPVCFTQNLLLIRSDLYLKYLNAFHGIPKEGFTLWCDAWRSSPNKRALLDFRAAHSHLKALEGPDLEQHYPLSAF